MKNNLDRARLGARDGVFLAIVLSLASFVLPEWLGGFNAWDDVHLAFHNVVAIVVRIAIFGMVGWTIGTYANRRRARAPHLPILPRQPWKL